MNIANVITSRFFRWRNAMADILSHHNSYMTVDDVYKECCSCQKLFFDNDEAFVVVNVLEFPRDTVLHIMLAGGTLAGLDRLDPVVYQFGQKIGASKATFVGRKGFAKVLERRGWKRPHIYMEKEIL